VATISSSGAAATTRSSAVELLQFDDAYMLGVGLTPIDLTNLGGLMAGVPLFGRAVSDQLTMGTNASNRLINLGADNDSLTLSQPDQTYNLNLANVETLNGSFGNETVNMSSTITNNMLVDLSFGTQDALNLTNGDDVVTVRNVETVFGFDGTDTVTFVHDDVLGGQHFDLGLGDNDVLNLAGSNPNYSLVIDGDMTVVGRNVNEFVGLTNVQDGSTFDLGGGTDTLFLFNDGTGNVVTVRNVETVDAVGFDSDQITIAGNTDITTVTAAGGADFITASADTDHFRFRMIGDSPDIAGDRDTVTGFDAAADVFVFDGDDFAGTLTWDLTNIDGQNIVRVDFNGDVVGDVGWDVAIEVDGLVGTLTNDNFLHIA